MAGLIDSDVLDRFRAHQRARSMSQNTMRHRGAYLASLARWAHPRSLLDLASLDIEAFLDGRDLGPASRRTLLSYYSGFYSWAVREDLCTTNPAAAIDRPRPRRRLPRPAATGELADALAHADRLVRCWIVLAAYAGLRCQEIAGLRVEDVIVTEGTLRVVQGKGGRERLLPLHPSILGALQGLPLPKSGYIFEMARGGRYSPAYLSRCFNRALDELGVHATAHQLRHWFGTALYRQARDLRLTQEMLGHASPATTAIYTAFDVESARVQVSALTIPTSA